jgi:hypothetical protein
VLIEVAVQLATNPDLQATVLENADLALAYILDNKAKITGRLATGILITQGLRKVAGPRGFILGVSLGAAAGVGNVRLAIERGGYRIEDIARALATGESPPLGGRKERFCR